MHNVESIQTFDQIKLLADSRRLMILQLVAMYFLAGVQKTGIHWYPMGHFAALYFILQDPAIAKHDFRWLAHPPWFQLTQLGSAITVDVLRWHGKAGTCTVEDLKSTNGTLVNGQPLSPGEEAFVRDGFLLRFGDADFAFFTAQSLYKKLMR